MMAEISCDNPSVGSSTSTALGGVKKCRDKSCRRVRSPKMAETGLCDPFYIHSAFVTHARNDCTVSVVEIHKQQQQQQHATHSMAVCKTKVSQA